MGRGAERPLDGWTWGGGEEVDQRETQAGDGSLEDASHVVGRGGNSA